jgi:ABC-type Fe3+/spermidine/putrescine transport system ATPase subunit
MSAITLRGLSLRYPGTEAAALRELDLEVRSGELVCLLGPSGCGKTTTLKLIAGLLRPSAGEVLFDGRRMNEVKPEHREAVMVFQSYLLFPYLNVADNIGFGLRMRRVGRAETERRAGEMIKLMRLDGLEKRRPSELSGGQQQRVALARALVLRPRVLLLDEPLSNLDAHLRDEMRELILRLQRSLQLTTVFVTHDQEEAVLLAQRVALLFDGSLHQFAETRQFYERPGSLRVADFFGARNFLEGVKRGNLFHTALGELSVRSELADGPATLVIRPEALLPGRHGPNVLEVPVVRQVYMGTHNRYRLEVDGREWEANGPPEPSASLEGRKACFTLPEDRIWLLRD